MEEAGCLAGSVSKMRNALGVEPMPYTDFVEGFVEDFVGDFVEGFA